MRNGLRTNHTLKADCDVPLFELSYIRLGFLLLVLYYHFHYNYSFWAKISYLRRKTHIKHKNLVFILKFCFKNKLVLKIFDLKFCLSKQSTWVQHLVWTHSTSYVATQTYAESRLKSIALEFREMYRGKFSNVSLSIQKWGDW